ncbi:CAP domain-containing protein [Candidatus Peregrinibacteria bacterium]|nr:CAP domain-containing protein [Candidatus Peregrinibacteria bacterium]
MKNKHGLPGNIFTTFVYAMAIALVLGWQTNAKTNDATSLFGESYSEKQVVPKKILAKALVQFLDLNEVQITNCYKDLKKTDSLSTAICTVKRAKIFKGTSSSKFKPDADVTWEFAIKSLCSSQKLPKNKTFSSCSAYNKKSGFLKVFGNKKILPKKSITYGELAKMMGGSKNSPAVKTEQNANPATPPSTEDNRESSIKIPDKQYDSPSFTPFESDIIGTDFFANVKLAAPMPNHFYKDEVYFIEGEFTDYATADEAYVFLCKDGQGCDNSEDFIEDTTNGGRNFRIPVYFKDVGNFQIGIIPGRSGQSRIENISVLPQPDAISGGQAPTELSTSYENGKTKFSWNGSGTFSRLVIFQNTNRVDYLFRRNVKSFSPRPEDFKNFKKGLAGWLVNQDSAQSPIKEMDLVTQEFRKVESPEIQTKDFQETFSTAPVHFSFSARALGPISKQAAFTLSDGTVEEFDFDLNDLVAGQDFKIEKDLKSAGTYIFEVNNPQGSAIINAPIYVGHVVPLIPDYFSLNPPELDKSSLGDLAKAREQLLRLINKDRATYELSPVALSNALNNIAQKHSRNMVDLDFFGHNDPDGNGPDDRRKEAIYPASIRENLAKATTLEDAENGLMRSPVHRAALLDPEMELVGLGMVKNSEGYVFVTQNFSAKPILQSDLQSIENGLLDTAKNTRLSDGLPGINDNQTLNEVSSSWAQKMVGERFFGVTSKGGEELLQTARNNGVKTSIQAHIVQASSVEQLKEELLKQDGLNNAANLNIGIGLGINGIGELFMVTLYTP